MKVKPGLGGRGAVTSMESMKHPNSHFEIESMNIKRAHDGSFVMEHRMGLKKKHQGKDEFHGGYREPETHTAADEKELMAHVGKHYGKVKGVPATPKPAAEDESAGEPGQRED